MTGVLVDTNYSTLTRMYAEGDEVVNRLAMELEEGTRKEYHVSKRDYALANIRVSPRKPCRSIRQFVEPDAMTTLSTIAAYLSQTNPFMDPCLDKVDQELFKRAQERYKVELKIEEETGRRAPWLARLQESQRMELHDLRELENEAFHGMLRRFQASYLTQVSRLRAQLLRERKCVEDEWRNETLKLLEKVRELQNSHTKDFYVRVMRRRRLGRTGDSTFCPLDKEEAKECPPPILDSMYSIPLLQRVNTIYRETGDEEEMVMRYMELAEKTERDLLLFHQFRLNDRTGAIAVPPLGAPLLQMDSVMFLCKMELYFAEQKEETMRMNIMDEYATGLQDILRLHTSQHEVK